MVEKDGSSVEGEVCKLIFSEDLTIYDVAELKTQLNEDIHDYEHYELNLQAVEEIDSAGAQLLMAINKTLTTKNKTFTVTEINEVVENFLRSYNLFEHLNIGVVE
jgi:anti-anti-sigma factor